ncbi:helix-turn-helix domain-containing protein, partial [Loktanella agnita]|uniref:helix-turn-helix domain-containing protein n=1 Tax=Loktanella agnita TaxID=287097 RepID=UPI003988EC47
MSHKATNWLSKLEADRIGASEFRVLFHLCDCHNATKGCFPTQSYLIEKTGASNGTVNNALTALEAKGLIRRHRAWDGTTKRQKPTRYMLGFEMADPSPKSGDGAVSDLRGKPSPIQRATRLQPTGEKPVKNQERTSARVRTAPFYGSKADQAASMWAGWIKEGKYIPPTAITASLAARMLEMKLVTQGELRAAKVSLVNKRCDPLTQLYRMWFAHLRPP